MDPWETLAPTDSAYLETAIKELYAAEMDRKDKILPSLAPLGTPVTVLIGGLTYLVNFGVSNAPDMFERGPYLAVIGFYLATVSAFACTVLLFWNFHRLLSSEVYAYVPPANEFLKTLLDVKISHDERADYVDGDLAAEGRRRFLPRVAEAAAMNFATNNIRLRQRQRLFRALSAALLCAGLALAMIALHHRWPYI